jgi:uncharacterized protein YdeI (YjbR/CyaY-like superfamily)
MSSILLAIRYWVWDRPPAAQGTSLKLSVVVLIAFCLVWPFYAFSETSRLPGLLGDIGIFAIAAFVVRRLLPYSHLVVQVIAPVAVWISIATASISGWRAAMGSEPVCIGRLAAPNSRIRRMSSMTNNPPPPNSIHPLTGAEWRAWLEQNHTRAEGVWLITYKKATGKPRIEYEEAVEQALCYGWIDSKPNKLDDERSLLWFAPRKAGTGWSKPNKDRVAKLMAAGLMAPAGLAKVEAAKADGSWFTLDSVETLEMPVDLGQALAANPAANGHFDAFPRSVKRGILEWIANAKRPETRARRVDETVRLAAENRRANQWRK